jgi:predicted chitinase
MIKWKEPTFDDTPLLKALAAANALRKAEEYDYEEEQKERGIAYPDWAKEWIKKYKEAWYIAEASGDQVSKDKARGLAEGLREKLADIAKMPDWAQQQMGKQTQIWMEANEVGNVKAMKVADEAAVGIRDKLGTIEKIKEQSPEDAKALNDLTAKWYSADDNEFVPYKDKDNYKGPEDAKKDYSDKAQAIMKKYEPKSEEKPKQTAISLGAQGTGKTDLTKEQLKEIGYSEDTLTDTFMNGFNYTIDNFIINGSTDQAKNKERIAKFIAQISVETGYGKSTVEQGSINYFNKTYGNAGTKESKMGDIVNEETGLRRYCGGGYIQLSTRGNYAAFAKDMNDSEILNQGVYYVAEHYSWQATGWWWKTNGMNSYIDNGATIEQVSKRVNGGFNGLDDRISVYNQIKEYLK